VSRTAGSARKRFAQVKAAGSGRGEAIIRTHFAARVRRRSRNIFGRGIGKNPGRRVGFPKKLR
jgi:hypothetical protein